MNKTVKTIAWICLVLGLLGSAVVVGVAVRGRSLMVHHQEALEAGEVLPFQCQSADGDDEGCVYKDDLRDMPFDRDGQFERGDMMGGGRGFNTFSNNRGGFPGGMRDRSFGYGGFVLPFLFLAGGPVLAIIGAVILIVNRTPKIEASSAKKEKSKKK